MEIQTSQAMDRLREFANRLNIIQRNLVISQIEILSNLTNNNFASLRLMPDYITSHIDEILFSQDNSGINKDNNRALANFIYGLGLILGGISLWFRSRYDKKHQENIERRYLDEWKKQLDRMIHA